MDSKPWESGYMQEKILSSAWEDKKYLFRKESELKSGELEEK